MKDVDLLNSDVRFGTQDRYFYCVHQHPRHTVSNHANRNAMIGILFYLHIALIALR